MLRKTTILALLILFGHAAPVLAAGDDLAPRAPALRDHVTVTDEIVRIGDLVEHAGPAARIAIFRAPDLGETGAVPVARVIDALRPHQIFAVDTRGLSEVTVTRQSRTVVAKDLETLIKRFVAGRLQIRDAGNIGITFDRFPHDLQVEANTSGEPRFARASFDPRSGRFDVTFEIPGSAAARQMPLRFTGSAVETVEAAVIARALNHGEVLRINDIALERRPRAEVPVDGITNVQAAVGQAARNALRPGQYLRQSDLMKPELVQRNETVMIYYEIEGITLTLRGKALESGSEGDVVSVMNTQTKRSLQGIVTGPGRVTVSLPSPRLVNLTASVQ
jgi:flagella basal body P-ring formation protein FlgA